MSSRLEIFLVLVCLSLTGLFFAISVKNNAEVVEGEFQRLTEDNVQALQARMMTYLQSVNGTAAFIAASDTVMHDDYNAYVSSLDIAEHLPSIAGLGFIVPVPDAELDAFADQMRAEGQPEFQLRRRSSEDVHYIVKFIEPRATNSQALGLDLSFAAERTKVLRAARDTREPKMTPPVQLVQEEQTLPGFVLFMPIYSQGQNAGDVGAFKGWVSAAFVAQNILEGLTSSQGDLFEIRVSDALNDGQAFPIFGGREADADVGNRTLTYQLAQFGRSWTVTYNSTPKFDAAFRSNQPIGTLIAGLVVTALLVLVLRSLQARADSLRKVAQIDARRIREREEENRSIVENAFTSVLVLDAAGRILVANRAAQNCFGYSEAELSNMRFTGLASEILDPDQTHNAIGHTKSGRTLELDMQCNVWLTREGTARTTAIIRDLTEQNKAQRDLSHYKTLNDMALQGSQIGVFDIDLTTGLSDVSETWCRIMGYPDGCNGMNTQSNFMERIHPDDLAILQEADKACMEGRTERSTAEYRLKSRDGQWCWMRSDAVIVERDSAGKALRMIGTQTDVTSLRHDRDTLEVSEQQFRQVVENAPIGMALMNSNGEFKGVNSAFCQLAGRDHQELMNGAHLAELMPSEDRKKLYTTISGMIEAEKTSVYTAEHRILCGTDEERWGLLNISWSFDKNEGENFFIAQIIDITDQKRLDLIKDEFVSTVSHELRTPLTSIKGALGLLMMSKDNNLTKSQNRLVEIAVSNADRLTAIVNDILDLEKISSGQISFNLDELELGELVEHSVQEMSPFASTHDSTLRVDLPADALSVLADMGRTKQVLANLISNACKYSNSNSEVLVKVERLDDMAIVYIQNTGKGVPESFKNRIFKAFSQADSSDTRAKGGTGLGLNISRQIVLRHGGQIGYESVPDGVTVFWFTMPLSETAAVSKTKPQKTDLNTNNDKLTVLHVEDDHDFAEIVASALEGFATVSHANSIVAARRLISGDPLDVVILDWALPDGSADQLFEDILVAQPNARVIALSADAERKNDPRLFANMVKSRTDLVAIAASVNHNRALVS